MQLLKVTVYMWKEVNSMSLKKKNQAKKQNSKILFL